MNRIDVPRGVRVRVRVRVRLRLRLRGAELARRALASAPL